MQCGSCKAEVPSTARFCPACAAPTLTEDDIKSGYQINIQWIERILNGMGYRTEPGASDPNVLIARHDDSPNLLVGHAVKANLITVQSSWNLKKPTWSQKGEFASAMNKANSSHWLCAFFHTDSFDSLTASGALPVTEQISTRDVVNYIEMFNTGALNTIQVSGLMKFA